MTAKELLREIKSRHKNLYNRYYCIEKYNFNENNKFLYDDLEKAINELEALKKPPTVDEVCEALSEYLNRSVKISKEKSFYYSTNSHYGEIDEIICGYGWEDTHYTLGFELDLPPHLITLIGRFYEGLEVKE